jgi:ribosome-associated heat shock protein Hsp15
MGGDGPVRLDKWLWAARFFKTRGLAQEAIAGGKVHLNGQRAKPSRAVQPGDRIEVTKEPYRFAVSVLAVAGRRGPAREAAKLYEESPASIAERERLREERRLQRSLVRGPERRPDKRARRHIIRFTRRRES